MGIEVSIRTGGLGSHMVGAGYFPFQSHCPQNRDTGVPLRCMSRPRVLAALPSVGSRGKQPEDGLRKHSGKRMESQVSSQCWNLRQFGLGNKLMKNKTAARVESLLREGVAGPEP